MIDAHCHLFRRAFADGAGLLGEPYLRRDFLWEDLQEQSAGLGLDGVVFVQVNGFVDPTNEANWLSQVAGRLDVPAAVIAWAHLEAPVLDHQLRTLSAIPRVVGVRRTTANDADPRFCSRKDFIDGLRAAGKAGFVCEATVSQAQLGGLYEAASAAPDTTIVLTHMGKPLPAEDRHEDWRRDMRRLGRLENVHCKISVVVQGPNDVSWTRTRVERWVNGAIEAFGWHRVLFASNWPVALAVSDYRGWSELIRSILARESEDDLSSLFRTNARSLYRLDDHAEIAGVAG